MAANRCQDFPIRRLLAIGVMVCALLMVAGESVWAQGNDLSKASPASRANLFSPEGAGLQAASWVLTVPYGAAKMTYAIGGGIVGGLAWAITGGNMEVAESVWIPSMTGDYMVQPPHLTGEMHLYFVGMSLEESL